MYKKEKEKKKIVYSYVEKGGFREAKHIFQ